MADRPLQKPDHDQSSDHQADDFWKIEGSSVSDGSRPPRQSRWLLAVYWLAGAVCLAFWVWLIAVAPSVSTPRVTIPYSVFRTQVRERNIASVAATGETIQGQLRKKITYPPGKLGETSTLFKTERPVFANDELFAQLLAEGATVGANPTGRSTPFWQSALGFVVPFLLIGGVFFLMMRGGRGAGGLSMFGKSKARRYEPTEQQTTFADIAGIDEATDELAEVVDFLRNPDRYRALGAIIPRGVLLTGPPGTGKTLLAKAVAGEAEVPFFSLSASEFIEMYVGVGASRVRDLFQRAKSEAPAIIFIDELDAIGRTRSGSSMSSGGHDEREQTLNQVLTEMDGFTGSEGVIVLAATNRPEILDAALLRPGRFDRRVAVNPPRPEGPRADPGRAHPVGAAGPGGRAGDDRVLDPGDGRRRPAKPGQRGGTARRAPRARRGRARRVRRRAGEDRARRGASHPDLSRGTRAHGLSRVRSRADRNARTRG